MIYIPIKYTINDVKEYVKNKSNCDLISSEYKGCDHKYDLICICGNKFQMSWSNIQRNQNICCKDCLGKILSKAMSFTYDEVKYFVEIESNSGCVLLSKQYTNRSQKLKLKCSCGNIFWKTLNDFKHGNQRQCNVCANHVVWDKELIIKYINKYPNIELINIKDDLNYNSFLLLKCECGVIYETTFRHFKRGIYKCCQDCMIEKRALNIIKHSYDEVKKSIESVEGYELLSNSYNGLRKKLKIKCNEGHIYNTTFDIFRKGHRCPACQISNRKPKSNEQFIEEVFDSVGDEYMFLEEYINAVTRIKCKHNKCGYIWEITPDNFLQGRRCPQCNESKGEQEVRKYLEENYIAFKQEYAFKDLIGVNGGSLRFDFAIFDHNNQLRLLIEYDGEFHFKKYYDEQNFDDMQIHDELKNNYCKNKNIKLARIPYWEFNNIEDILKEVLYESI